MSIDASRPSEQRFRALIERSIDAIALLTREGMVTYSSPSTERVTGYRAEELVGMNGCALLHPEDLKDVQQQFADILDRPGDSIVVEYRLHQKNGTWRWMEGTLTNLLGDPAVEAVVCNCRNIAERYRAQERLRQSEERYRMLVEQASDGIFVTDPQGKFVEVNAAVCVLSGYNREELLAKSVEDLIPEEDRAVAYSRLERLRAGETAGAQLRIQCKDDSLLLVELSAIQLATGHLLGIVRERSVRIQAETRANELDAIFEAMTDVVVVCNHVGEIRYTNAAYRSLFALEADVNPSFLPLDKRIEWLAPKDLEGRPMAREQFPLLRVLRGERLSGTHTIDHLCRTRKGEDLIVNVGGTPIRDTAGRIVGGVVVLRDVTEWRHLKQRLQYSERKLHSLVESNIFGVIVADSSGRIHEVNDRFTQLVDYSKDELLCGAVTQDQLMPPDYYETLAQVEEMRLTAGAMPPMERECVRKDGSRVPTLMAGALIDQERDLALMVILDISEQKAAERRKQDFLSMVSHELRTPLTSIMGFLDLALLYSDLFPRPLSPEAEQLLDKMEAGLKRAMRQVEIETRLVEELLEVSRLELHTFELSLHRENLVTIVQETVANQQQAARMRQIELVLPPDEVVPVLADAGRIGQALTNYLTNALKYTPVDQPVSVRLEVEASFARVSVRDQGPGLTVEQQHRVWERFYQVAAPGRHGPDRGLGLGLAIARTIIEQHQGQVGVQSAPGRGSTFWFTLPLAAGLIQV